MRRRLYMPLLKNNNHGLTNNGHLSRQIYRVNLLAYIILPPLQKTAEHWSQIRTRQTLPKNHFCADKAPPRHQDPMTIDLTTPGETPPSSAQSPRYRPLARVIFGQEGQNVIYCRAIFIEKHLYSSNKIIC